MPELKEVIAFPGANLGDIPARLRTLANTIEAGINSGAVVDTCIVALRVDGRAVDLYGWGPGYDKFNAIAMLDIAKDMMKDTVPECNIRVFAESIAEDG